MQGKQQTQRVHEPKDKRIWGYKVTSKSEEIVASSVDNT